MVEALTAVGIEYVHAKFAGNPKTLRSQAPSHAICLEWYAALLDEKIEIVETFEALVAGLTKSGKRVCIACFERHAEDCHRGVLAARWKARGRRKVKHLAVDGCARIG